MITIVGGLPEPIGGVSTFIKRLAFALCGQTGDKIEILDIYPGTNKVAVPPGVRHAVGPRLGFFRLLWLTWNVIGKPTVHFNFSTPRGLLFLALLPKLRSRWILTLHHGNLSAIYDNAIIRTLWPWLARRIDQIVALSEQQQRYYLDQNLPAEKVILGGSYMRPVRSHAAADPRTIALAERLRSTYQTVVFASGYPTAAYRHRELIGAFNALAADRSACLVLCLYGPDSEGLLSTIRQEAADSSACVELIGPMDEVSFNYLLKGCNIYVRANSVDSCGIALFDAMSFGVRVLASDVCRRPPGALLFQSGNYHDLQTKLSHLLDGSQERAASAVHVEDNLDFYDLLYHNPPRAAA